MLKPMVQWTKFAGFCSHPSAALRKAQPGSDQLVATVHRSWRDLNEDSMRLQIDTLVAGPGKGALERLSMPAVDGVKPVAMEVSQSGRVTCVIRNAQDDRPIIELNSIDGGCFKVDASEHHGKVVGDGFIGLISFSKDEKFVAYVANSKARFKKLNSLLDITEDAASRGSKFEPLEDWGEKYDGVSSTVVCIINVLTGKVTLLPPIPGGERTSGQPVLRVGADGSYSVIFTSWRSQPKRLGMIYCYQRPCELYKADVTQLLAHVEGELPVPVLTFESLTGGLALARSPRLSPSGDKLLFIGRGERLCSHNGCFSLYSADIVTGELKAITAIIGNPAVEADGSMGFPGIYADQLPKQCFLDEGRVVLSSMWGSVETAIIVDTATGSIEKLNGRLASILFPEYRSDEREVAGSCSCAILDVHDGHIIFSCSSPTRPQRVGAFCAKSGLLRAGPENKLSTIALGASPAATDGTPETAEKLAKNSWRVLRHRTAGIPFESILVLPNPNPAPAAGPKPLIVVPHGGPHSCMPTAYVASYAYLSSECDAYVLHVNYRGSTGFGQTSVDSLPGNIGCNDVADVVAAVEDALRLYPDAIDKARLAVVGGSHGGFLAAHLIGQHPLMFKACALRNPVTNILSMFGVTDIPDWCVVEAAGRGAYDFESYCGLLSDDTLLRMKRSSPVFHVDSVVAPVLMALGAKDRRVPASQGTDYYHMLRARGVATKLLLFPEDSHAIDRPASEAEHFVAIAMWFNEHLAAAGAGQRSVV